MYHAEHLSSIGQVSITLDFPHAKKDVKGVAIQNNTVYIVAPKQYAVQLPGTFVQANIASYSLHNGTLSLKVAVKRHDSLFMSRHLLWSAADLLQKTPKNASRVNLFSFHCARCGARLIDSESARFSDMPSEFWHELMDFWHCHKPHEPHHLHNDKNYSTLAPSKLSVLIGALYLFTQTAPMCACGFAIGERDDVGTRLHKWNLTLKYAETTEEYPPYAFVYNALYDKINSTAGRRFAMKCGSSCLDVWVVNVGIDAQVTSLRLRNALKVLYREGQDPEAELVELDTTVFESLQQHLKTVNGLLPAVSRTTEIQEESGRCVYNVGYLNS